MVHEAKELIKISKAVDLDQKRSSIQRYQDSDRKKPVENRYIKDFWGNIYHQSHSNDLSNCENCNRLICKELTLGGYKIDEKRNNENDLNIKRG